jgi:hypothetical protein
MKQPSSGLLYKKMQKREYFFTFSDAYGLTMAAS